MWHGQIGPCNYLGRYATAPASHDHGEIHPVKLTLCYKMGWVPVRCEHLLERDNEFRLGGRFGLFARVKSWGRDHVLQAGAWQVV